MPIPKNKTELLAAIHLNYQKLKTELHLIPLAKTKIPELPGHAKGTTMSIHNLVAYLVGWGELVLKWHHKKSNNETVDFPETGYKWNELGHLAQKFYADYAALPFPELLKRLDTTVLKITSLIEQYDDTDLYETPWYGKYPLGRMIQLNTSSPYKNALTRVRKWKKEQQDL